MPTLQFETIIPAPLDEVWALFDDPVRGLPALSPPKAGVRIERADVPVREGSVVEITAKGPVGRIRWVARVVEHRPPHDVVFGREARFVDEQAEGPFEYWRHEHEFEAVDGKTTRMIDRVTYRVGLGPVGWVADVLLVRRKVRGMFRDREAGVRRVWGEAG